jgi:hypothetical protein
MAYRFADSLRAGSGRSVRNQLDAQIYFWNKNLHVSDSSSVHHQEFYCCTHSNGTCHTGLLTQAVTLNCAHCTEQLTVAFLLWFSSEWNGAGRHLRRAAGVYSHPVNTIQRARNGHLYLRPRSTGSNLQRQNKTDQLSTQDYDGRKSSTSQMTLRKTKRKRSSYQSVHTVTPQGTFVVSERLTTPTTPLRDTLRRH